MRHIGILVAALVITVAALSVGTVLATPGSGVTPEIFSRATLGPFHLKQKDFQIRSKHDTDVVMRKATIAVNGHSGWHTHPGPTFALVKVGEVEVTRVTRNGCITARFGPGEGFVERADEVHIARNVGDVPAELYITDLNVPVGGAPLDLSPAAPDCAAVGDGDDTDD